MVELEADLQELMVGLPGSVESVEGCFSSLLWSIFCVAALLKNFVFPIYVSHFLGDCYHWHETTVPLLPYSTTKSLSYILCS